MSQVQRQKGMAIFNNQATALYNFFHIPIVHAYHNVLIIAIYDEGQGNKKWEI